MFVEGVTKDSQSWDIYIDDRTIQGVYGRNPKYDNKLTGCEVVPPTVSTI